MDTSRGGRAVVDGSPVPGCIDYTTGTHTFGLWACCGFIATSESVVTFTDQTNRTVTSITVPAGVTIPVYIRSITVTSGKVLMLLTDAAVPG